MKKIFLLIIALIFFLPNKSLAMSGGSGSILPPYAEKNKYWATYLNIYDLADEEANLDNFEILCPYFFQIENYICMHTYADDGDAGYKFFSCYSSDNQFGTELLYTLFNISHFKSSSFDFELMDPDKEGVWVSQNLTGQISTIDTRWKFYFVDLDATNEELTEEEYHSFSGCPTLNYVASETIDGFEARNYYFTSQDYKISIAYNRNYLNLNISNNVKQIKSGIENMVCISANCPSLNYSVKNSPLFAGGSIPNSPGSNSGNNSGTTPGSPNDKYSGIETCTEIDVKRIKACGCIPAEIADITSKVYFILRIVGPVLLLILGGFDMAKAIASQDESSIEKAKKKLVNKFIAAASIFLILTVIEFIVSLLAKNATGIMDCINILLDGYKI